MRRCLRIDHVRLRFTKKQRKRRLFPTHDSTNVPTSIPPRVQSRFLPFTFFIQRYIFSHQIHMHAYGSFADFEIGTQSFWQEYSTPYRKLIYFEFSSSLQADGLVDTFYDPQRPHAVCSSKLIKKYK